MVNFKAQKLENVTHLFLAMPYKPQVHVHCRPVVKAVLFLLTEWRTGWENIWPEVMVYRPTAVRSLWHDWGPNNYFPVWSDTTQSTSIFLLCHRFCASFDWEIVKASWWMLNESWRACTLNERVTCAGLDGSFCTSSRPSSGPTHVNLWFVLALLYGGMTVYDKSKYKQKYEQTWSSHVVLIMDHCELKINVQKGNKTLN